MVKLISFQVIKKYNSRSTLNKIQKVNCEHNKKQKQNKTMGCNTSQEQQNAVSESNGDIVNHDSKQTPRNSAKSEKESKSAKSTKSTKNEKSDKLTNGHENEPTDDQKSEGMT